MKLKNSDNPAARALAFICLIFILWGVNCAPSYQLFREPIELSDLISHEQQYLKVIFPERSDLVIVISAPLIIQWISIDFYRIKGKSIEKVCNVYQQKKTLRAVQFTNAFWIYEQYLLLIGLDKKIMVWPAFADQEEQRIFPLKGQITLNLLSSIRESSNGVQLTTLSSNITMWVLHKYEIFRDRAQLMATFHFSRQLLQIQQYMITLKDFVCINNLLSQPKDNQYYLYCYDFERGGFLSYKEEDVKVYLMKGDPKSNDIYFITRVQVYKYTLVYGQKGEIKMIRHQVTQTHQIEPIDDVLISEHQIVVTTLTNPSFYILNKDNYFPYQIIMCQQKYELFPALGLRDNQLIIVAGFDDSRMNKLLHVIFTSWISYQVNYVLIIGCLISFSIVFLSSFFISLTNCAVLQQFIVLWKIKSSQILQFTIILILYGVAYIQTFTKGASSSDKFAPTPSNSASVDSFSLKILSTLFQYTALISLLFESLVENKGKVEYLNPLTKHGLSIKTYLGIRINLLFIKGLVYSSTAICIFYSIDYLTSKPQNQLNISFVEAVSVFFVFWAGLIVVWSWSFFLLYLFDSFWVFLNFIYAVAFLINFAAGEFYLTRDFSIEERILASLSPFALFPAITQHIFRVEMRFNESVTGLFLFGSLIAQVIIGISCYILGSYRFLQKTSLEEIIKIKPEIPEGKSEIAINSSVETESFSSKILKQSSLLKVFIPCKLSQNEGFEKKNVLKNVSFEGRRGEIITFLDEANYSKSMLFQIIINNQKSDSHTEKDILGEVVLTQNVKLSCCLSPGFNFSHLTVCEHLELFALLKMPKKSKSQRLQDVKFMLNEFNFPDQFIGMQAASLSGGYLKKLHLACAFIGKPDIIIIDEPSLGLDLRFRGVLYRKLQQWKQDKLILIGTSDREQAQCISDHIYVLQKARMMDYMRSQKRKQMAQITIRFISEANYLRGLEGIRHSLGSLCTFYQQECNVQKQQFKITLQIYDEEESEYQKHIVNLMTQLNQTFDLKSNNCLVNIMITQQPYTEYSYNSLKNTHRKSLSFQQIEMYLKNNSLSVSSDDQLTGGQNEASNLSQRRVSKLLETIMAPQINSHLLYFQFLAIFYKQFCLWKGYTIRKELFISSLYFWIQSIFLNKINRSIIHYDFTNLLIIYSFLHFSLSQFRLNSRAQKAKSFTIVKGAHPLIIELAHFIFSFTYIFFGFVANLLIFSIFGGLIIDNYQQPHLWNKSVCSFIYTFNFALFSTVLSLFIKRTDLYSALVFLIHVVFTQITFSSFLQAYQSQFHIFQILAFVFYPFTITTLYKELISDGTTWIYILSCLLQSFILGFIVKFVIRLHATKKSTHVQLKGYINIYNQTIDNQREILQNLQDHEKAPLIGDDIIHKYGTFLALRNLSFHLKKGQIVGVLGHNGCGKSTAFKVVAGQVHQSSGVLSFFGVDKGLMDQQQRLKIGYCPQSDALEEQLTVEQNIRFYGRLHGLKSKAVTLLMTRALHYFRLKGIELVKVKYLSQAERKKTSFIIAFIGSPNILLLDEITSGMEPEGQRKALNLVRQYCKQRSAAVFMATHKTREAEDCCDRVIVLKNGVMKCCGTPTRMRMAPAQQFFLVTLYFNNSDDQLVLDRKKAAVKDYIYSLSYFRIELQDRFKFIYSLDFNKFNIVLILKQIFHFYSNGILQKLEIGRHGLREVVAYANSESDIKDGHIFQDN